METTSVNCNNCGAPLEVGAGTNFVTCQHCGSRLAIKRTGSSAYTELLEKLDQKTDVMAEQLAEIVRQNEVERIDREWEQEKAGFMIRNKDGSVREPSATGGVFMAAVMTIIGIVWIGGATSMQAPCFVPLFGLLFIGVAVVVGVAEKGKAHAYQEAQTRYRKRRAEALAGKKDDEPGQPGIGG